MTDPKASGLTKASQETVRTIARLTEENVRLRNAWHAARASLPLDRDLNAPWSQAIAIMDEAMDAALKEQS